MTSKIRAIRLSHFWSAAFIVMLVNTGMNIFILGNTYQSYNYPGLLIGMIFFGGLAALMSTKLGLHPQLNSGIFALALVPEFINIYAMSPESFSGLVFSTVALVLSLDKRINKTVRSILLVVGVLNFDLTKLDELGTSYSEIAAEYVEIASVIVISSYIVFRYFDDNSSTPSNAAKQKEDVIDQDEYQENMKFWLNPNFKYRIRAEQYDFLSKSLVEPLESSYPFLRNYAQAGSSDRYPLIRIYTVNGAPIMEATNIAFAEEAEISDLKSILRRHDYDIYMNTKVEDAFNIAPVSLKERFVEKQAPKPISEIQAEGNRSKKNGVFKRKNKDNFVVQADLNGNDILIGAPFEANQSVITSDNEVIIGGPLNGEVVSEEQPIAAPKSIEEPAQETVDAPAPVKEVVLDAPAEDEVDSNHTIPVAAEAQPIAIAEPVKAQAEEVEEPTATVQKEVVEETPAAIPVQDEAVEEELLEVESEIQPVGSFDPFVAQEEIPLETPPTFIPQEPAKVHTLEHEVETEIQPAAAFDPFKPQQEVALETPPTRVEKVVQDEPAKEEVLTEVQPAAVFDPFKTREEVALESSLGLEEEVVQNETVEEEAIEEIQPVADFDPFVDQKEEELQVSSTPIEEPTQRKMKSNLISRMKSTFMERYQTDTAAAQEEKKLEEQQEEVQESKNKFVDPQYREKRKFDPNAGRSLAQFRTIDEDGGSQDFQWNVPSK